MRGDLGGSLLQETTQDPNNFEHCNQTNEPWGLFTQLLIEDFVGLTRLFRVVLEQIAEDDVGIEPNPLSQIWKNRGFQTFFGATFGATLYRDFVRARSTLCKCGESVYMIDI